MPTMVSEESSVLFTGERFCLEGLYDLYTYCICLYREPIVYGDNDYAYT